MDEPNDSISLTPQDTPADEPNLDAPPVDAPPADAPPAEETSSIALDADGKIDYSKIFEGVEYELPEGFTIMGKEVGKTLPEAFQTLEKRMEGLRKLNAEKGYSAPEEYDFSDVEGYEADDEGHKALTELFKSADLSNEQAKNFLPVFKELADEVRSLAMKGSKADLMDEWGVTGDQFDARFDTVNKWASKNLPEDVLKTFAGMGIHGIKAAEAMMNSKSENKIWKGEDLPEVMLTANQVVALQASEAYTDKYHPDHEATVKQVQDFFAAGGTVK